MKVKELIELLQQSDPEKEVAIEYRDIDEFGFCNGSEYAMIDSSDCKSKDDLLVINIEYYQYLLEILMRTVYIIANNFSPYTDKTYTTFAGARAALSGDRFHYTRPYCRICETTQELINSYYDEFCRDPDLYSEDEDAHMDLFNRSFTVIRW